MQVDYLPSFIKDLKALKSTPVFTALQKLAFEQVPNCKSFSEIGNLKKLRASDTAYRLRFGDYRIGLLFENETVTFVRVLHRKEIYRFFP